MGKTTTAVNLGAYLARKVPVLLVDLDPQANSTLHLGADPEELEASMYDVLRSEHKDIETVIRSTEVEGLGLAPGVLSLGHPARCTR